MINRKMRRALNAQGALPGPIPMFTTIVYGEGMDTVVMNAIAIQNAFGLTHIVPEWDGTVQTMEKGALHLIRDEPNRTREEMEAEVGYPLRVIPVATAKEMVLIDGKEWREAP